MRAWRSPPSTYSITMNKPVRPSSSTSRSAITRTMWGEAARAMARASVRKRRVKASSAASSGAIALSATGMPSAVSSAR